MSELLSIWNDTQLRAANSPPPFNIPNNPNAKTIKINNQSRYWLILYKTNSNIDVDRIEPFSYLTVPFEKDISIKVDSTGTAWSSLQADKMFVDYSTIDGGVIVFSKGSTQFSGSSSVTINGGVTITNSSLNVAIQGTPTFNLAANSTVTISGTPTINVGTMPNVTIANAAIKVQIDQTGGNNTISLGAGSTVSISGTPTMNVGTMPAVTFAAGSSVTISGTPTMNVGTMPAVTFAAGSSVSISSGTINVGTMPSVTIGNATLNVKFDTTTGNNNVVISGTPSVTISGTPTINVGTMSNVTFAAGSTVTISGTPTMNIGTMPNVTFAAGSTVTISGTPTINVGTMPSVTIGNATLNVKFDTTTGNNNVVISGTPSVTISGTPTINVGTMPSVTFAAGSTVTISGTPTMNIGTMPSVVISGTPTMNIGTMPSVTFAAGSTVTISGTPTMNIGTMPNVTFAAGSTVTISGSPTMNIGTMPNVTIANSTLNVALSGTNTVNIGSMPNINVASGTITVSSATVVNSQLPVAQVYSYKQVFTYPANSTIHTPIEIQFLPNGTVADVQKGTIYIKSALNVNYNFTTLFGRTAFADGTIFDGALFNYSSAGSGEYDFSGSSTLCNMLHFTIYGSTATPTVDTVTVYYLIDGTSTAIDTPIGYGVPVQPSSDSVNDVSGTIGTANVSQVIFAQTSYYNRRYFFFQNISSADMWINWTNAAMANNSGSILIPANGGSIVYEGSFIPRDQLSVACSLAGANFTCKWA